MGGHCSDPGRRSRNFGSGGRRNDGLHGRIKWIFINIKHYTNIIISQHLKTKKKD